MFRFLSFVILLTVVSCTSNPVNYVNEPLIRQILKAVPGHGSKLVNRACLTYQAGKCLKEEWSEYDPADPAFRAEVIKMGFICNVANQRYKFCPDRPGFCQYSYYKDWFLGAVKLRQDYIPLEPFQFHIDARTKCFQRDTYPFDPKY